MSFFDEFPNTNFHELNMDWVINKLMELEKRIEILEEKEKNNV